MRHNPAILPALVAAAFTLSLALPAAAERIYRYVDKEGVVTYSSNPPAEVERARDLTELNAPRAPRPEDVEAAKKRAQEDAKLARELFKERRQSDMEYERIRAAAVDRAFQEEMAAAQYPSGDVYYPAAGYLPYYPMWGASPRANQRPPFRDPPPFARSHFHKSPASFTTEPKAVPFRRR